MEKKCTQLNVQEACNLTSREKEKNDVQGVGIPVHISVAVAPPFLVNHILAVMLGDRRGWGGRCWVATDARAKKLPL